MIMMFSEVANGMACLKSTVMLQKLKQWLSEKGNWGSLMGRWLAEGKDEPGQLRNDKRKEWW